MDLNDITPENFFEKFTYSSDPNQGGKIVMSNGAFAQCAIMLKLINGLEKLRLNIR